MNSLAEKRDYKGIRIPQEFGDKLQKLAEWLYENGFQSFPNYSGAMSFVLRRADKLGLLDPPKLSSDMDKALTGLDVAISNAKASTAQKPKK
jgi:hypothetical protein